MSLDHPDTDQLAMFEMPAAPSPPEVSIKRRKPPAHSAPAGQVVADVPQIDTSTPLGSLAAMFITVSTDTPGVMLVDPRAIVVDPINVHSGVTFDPAAHAELIESMAASGNTVPVRLRPDPVGGPGFSCVSGARRLGAALHIQASNLAFRLRAIITPMSDRQAFEVAEGDNAGRTGVAPLRQAEKWAETLEAVYAGNRSEFIKATGKSASVVSRTLALLTLPQYVLDCCADTYALTPYFAEQLAPRLANVAEEVQIRQRAEALIAAGRRLPPAKLATVLLTDPSPAPQKNSLWTSADNSHALTVKPAGRGSIRLELNGVDTLNSAQRRELLKAVEAHLRTIAA